MFIVLAWCESLHKVVLSADSAINPRAVGEFLVIDHLKQAKIWNWFFQILDKLKQQFNILRRYLYNTILWTWKDLAHQPVNIMIAIM